MSWLIIALLLAGLFCGVCAVILFTLHKVSPPFRKLLSRHNNVKDVLVKRTRPVRIGAILAAHTSSAIKHAVAVETLRRLREAGVNDIVVINSDQIEFPLPKQCENHPFLVDHRKFYEGLRHISDEVDVVIMINDSCLITDTLRPFVKMIEDDAYDTEVYGYVEAPGPPKYYQSMLRAFNRVGVATFKRLYEAAHIESVPQLIREFELEIGKHFKSRKVLYPSDLPGDRHFTAERVCTSLQDGYALLKLKALWEPFDRFELDTPPPKDWSAQAYKDLYHDIRELPDEQE